MKSGLYRYPDSQGYSNIYNKGEFILKLKETDKAYIMELVRNDLFYSSGHLEMMFGKGGKARVPKDNKCPHAMNTSGDDWFCLYPCRAGIPFAFEYIEEEVKK